MTIIVGLDRDGTINKDENYFLGIKNYWKLQLEILPGVIDGIKILNKVNDLEVFIITNQYGVAIVGDDFNNLDEKRMNDVNNYILELLDQKDAKIRGCISCQFIDEPNAKKHLLKGRKINPDYYRENHFDIKPSPGMLVKAAESIGKNYTDCRFYTIGDRYTDVLTALNLNGSGFLVKSTKTLELNDIEILQKHPEYQKRAFLAPNFLSACESVYDLESKIIK